MADDSSKNHMCYFENCCKTFSKLSRLVTHMRSHTGERPYVCEYEGCEKQYKRSDHLRRHEVMSHWAKKDAEGKETPLYLFRCEEEDCKAEFKSCDNLDKHIRKHHELKMYKCHISGCGAEFKKHNHLQFHRREHSEANPYCCPEPGCGKSFPFPNKLKRHAKIHEGYICKVLECGAKFDKWSLLVKHNKVSHTSVHECPDCKKTFNQKQWLKQHMLVHSASRPMYICNHDNCGREYLSQRNLNSHIRSYHDGKRFSCDHKNCGQTFASKQKLQQHCKLHDPNRPLPKKKPKKRKAVQKLMGISMETEVRGQDSDNILKSPNPEDTIPGLPDMESFIDEHSKNVTNMQFNTEDGMLITVSGDNDAMEIIVTNKKTSMQTEINNGKKPDLEPDKTSKINEDAQNVCFENDTNNLNSDNDENVEMKEVGMIKNKDDAPPVCITETVVVVENINNLNSISNSVENIANKLLNHTSAGDKMVKNSCYMEEDDEHENIKKIPKDLDEHNDAETDMLESGDMVIISSDS